MDKPRIEKEFTDYRRSYVVVYRGDSGQEFEVRVDARHDLRDFSFEDARVNWSCHGSTTPKEVKRFIEALTKAVELAAELDAMPRTNKDTPHA